MKLHALSRRDPSQPIGLGTLRARLVALGVLVCVYLVVLQGGVSTGLADSAWWGIAAQPTERGFEVVGVEPNGLAWDGGIRPGTSLQLPPDSRAGSSVRPPDATSLNQAEVLLVERSDGRTVELSSRGHGFGDRLGILVIVAVGLCFVGAGSLVFLTAHNRRQASGFAGLCGVAALGISSVPAGVLGQVWAIRLAFVVVALVPLLFARFFATFPIDRTGRPRCRLLVGATLGMAVLALAAYTLALSGHAAAFVWAQRFNYANMVLGYGAGLALLVDNYVRGSSPRARQQLRLAVGGTLAGTLPFFVLAVLPNALVAGTSGGPRIVAPEVAALATVLIPLSFGYAIVRHELIRADQTIRRAVLYVSATLVTTICYLLAISVFQQVYILVSGQSSPVALLSAALLVALFVEPLQRSTQRWVERALFVDVHAYRQVLESLDPVNPGIARVEELVPLVFAATRAALPVQRLALYIADRQGEGFRLGWDERGRRGNGPLLAGTQPSVETVGRIGRASSADLPLPATPGASGSGREGGACLTTGGWRSAARPDSPASAGLRLEVLVPFRSAGRAIALLGLGSRGDGEPYTGADLEFLDLVAERYAVALDNALLLEEVRRQADTDALTGVFNHRYLLEALAHEVLVHRAGHRSLAVLMMDVNSFKFFNDTYGHPVGDEVLIAVSDALRESCRPRDVFGRYGGDEFVAVLPDTDRAEAERLADRFNAAAQELTFRANGIGPLALAVTIGVASLPEDGDTAQQLISAADVAMYGRKRAARTMTNTLPDTSDLPTGTLRALVVAVQQKDGYLASHSERTAHLAVRIAVALGLNAHAQQVLRVAGLVHDVGKLGIPETVLNKRGPLTPAERAATQTHPELSARLLVDVPYHDEVVEAVIAHHERWDGLGYPFGLAADSIPLTGRILAAADVYSAMTTDRAYRRRLNLPAAYAEIETLAGNQLDPVVTAALLRVLDEGNALESDEAGGMGCSLTLRGSGKLRATGGEATQADSLSSSVPPRVAEDSPDEAEDGLPLQTLSQLGRHS